ncbi:MAG TPA: hypothetical protein VJ957_07105 [Longimicrobiales bacterium]|nr:hypothetical protein [Longimicrobiales bacterium]
MVEATERSRGSYRCPVCGHHDMAAVPAGRETTRIQCSHCGTELELTLTAPDAESFSVNVGERPASA